MTKRWERELRTLNDIPAPLERIRDRADQGPSGGGGLDLPPRRQRIVAGVVAFAVFAAVGAFAWRAFDLAEPSTPGDSGDLPVLSVTFESAGFIDDGPDSSTRRVDTVIDYGDAHEENFTSTIPDNAVVEWVGVGQLTPYVPGPTAGSAVTINADGQDPRVLIGAPEDWPSFRKFERIDHLPSSPGDYVLLFEADYPEGRAMTARRVNVVEPGVLQLLLTEGGKLDGARASAYVDGDGVDGFLSTSTFAVSDVGGQSTPRAPVFGGQKRLLVTNGATIILGTPASAVSAGLVERYSLTPDHLPLDLSENEPTLSSSSGDFLLAVDARWLHGVTTYKPPETKETARFFFPIEVVSAANQPSVELSPDSTDTTPPPALKGTIAYIEGHQGFGPITLLDTAAGSVEHLSGGGYGSITVAWAPDGSTIAVKNALFEGNGELVLVSATSGEIIRTLPIDPLLNPIDVDWAPDGESLAFTDTYAELYTIDADGSGLQRIRTEGFRALDIAWSPDGTEIAFASDKGQLAVVGLESGQTDVVFDSPGEHLSGSAWSPDGKYLAFSMSTDAGDAIFVIRRDGTGLTQLTDSSLNGGNPTWSPDGAWIAFEGGSDGDAQDLYAVTQDGSSLVQLIDTGEDEYGPDWG